MKYAIMSDAHAKPAALLKVVDDAKDQACGRFVFLGDAVGYGYDAKTTVDILQTQFDVVLRGNHDVACRQTLAREDAEWLRSRADRHDGDGLPFFLADPLDVRSCPLDLAPEKFIRPLDGAARNW